MVKKISLDKIPLMAKIVKGNFKTIFLISLSLSFILTTVVSFCIILDSNNSSLFKITQRQLDENYEYHLKLEILYQQNYHSYQVATIDQILTDVNTHLDEFNMNKYLRGSWIDPRIAFFNHNASIRFQYGHAYYYEDERGDKIKNFLVSGSRLPQHANETILVIRNDARTNYSLNSRYYFSSDSPTDSSFPLTVVGIILLKEYHQFPSREFYLNYIKDIRISTGINLGNHFYSLIVRKNDYSNLVKKIGESSLVNPSGFEERGSLEIYLFFNSYELNVFESYSYLERLKSFKENINGIYNYYDKLEHEIKIFHQYWFTLFLTFSLIAFPVFIISFYFTNFIVDNTNFTRLKRNESLIIRGISFRQILILYLLEAGVSFVFIIILGLLFGFFLSLFLIYFMNAASHLIININNWLIFLIIIALVSVGLVYGKYGRTIARVNFGEVVISFESNQDVQIHSWAFKAFLFGIVTFSLSILVIILDPPFWTLSSEDSVIIDLIFYYSISISLMVMSIGLIFSLKPLFSLFVKKFSPYVWKKYNNILALALKNIKRYLRAFSNVWLFLTLLTFYSFLLITSYATTNHHLQEQAEFFTGADYRIGFTESNEAALTNFLIQNLSEKISFSKVVVANMFYKLEVGKYGGEPDLNILGIDPENYFNVAYNHPQTKFTPSINKFQEKIQNNNFSVSVSRGFLQKEELSIGDTYSLNLLAKNLSWNIPEFYHPIANVTLISSFEKYPLIATYPKDRAMIMHQKFLEGLEKISDEPSSITKRHFLLLKCNEIISQGIFELLEEKFAAEVTSIDEELAKSKQDRSWAQYISSHQTIIIVALLLSFGCLINFGFLQENSRTREHAIERTLGLKRREILQVTLLEELIVTTLALASGICVGIVFSYIFFCYQSALWKKAGLAPSGFLPIYDLFGYIIWYVVFMIISIIPSIIVHQRYDIGSLLKRYE